MVIAIDEKVTFSDEIKSIIKSGKYERIVFELMKRSNIIFPNNYFYNEVQSCGECDFVDAITGEKYDAKLPFTDKQGMLLGSNNSNYLKWYKSIQEELEEISEYIKKKKDAKDLQLYKIMEKILKKDKNDENIIILFPFPVVLDVSIPSLIQFCGDGLTIVFKELKKNNIIDKRKMYVIYPSFDGKMVLRCLNTDKREYISSDCLKKYINYEMVFVE